jgi:Type IV secretory pathway, VirD4 components
MPAQAYGSPYERMRPVGHALSMPVPQEPLLAIGRTNYRYHSRVFGIREGDRFSHLYIVGQTGTGKSTLLENLVLQDLAARRGVAFLDPHGDSVARVFATVATQAEPRQIFFDAADPKTPIGFNPLEAVPAEQRALAASGIIEAFKNVWERWWGPRLEHILRNGILTLLDQPTTTLADLLRLFDDLEYRKRAVTHIVHPAVRAFWESEFRALSPWGRAEALAPLRNKLGAFLSQPSLHRILTKERSSFDLRRVMDSGNALFVNLSKGRMGSDASSLLGALLVTRIGLAALARADAEPTQRRPFFVYLDEFQNFTTLSVASMLSELRKYGVGLTLAHQYLGQLVPEVREAVLGNAGSMIAFRVGPHDAALLERYFLREFTEGDLMSLPNRQIYLRLMVDGQVTRPFSAETLPPRIGASPNGTNARPGELVPLP